MKHLELNPKHSFSMGPALLTGICKGSVSSGNFMRCFDGLVNLEKWKRMIKGKVKSVNRVKTS